VVADAAYPAQSESGIETILANENQIHVLRRVMNAITACRHIRASVYTDSELAFVAENDAPGITVYRQQLNEVLGDSGVQHTLHEQIIQRLAQAAQAFRILVIKTELTIPYTSVFFELDCGYWNAEAEARLRQTIVAAHSRQGESTLTEAKQRV
jgi:hypothetical protein